MLVIDIGGNNGKILATGQNESRKFPSGPTLTPEEMVAGVKKLAGDWKYDVVSIGYPAMVVRNRLIAEPHNLGRGWMGFDFEAAFKRPVKVVKDVERNGNEACLVNRADIRSASAVAVARERRGEALQRRRLAEAAMDPAIQSAAITALAAVMGSLVGGLASFATTYFTQRNQAHRDLVSRNAAHREELYSQFINEAANRYADSLDKTLTNPTMLIGMYSLVGRIRLVSSDKVLAAAEKVADSIVDSYRRPPVTFEDVWKVVRESKVDPLKYFTEACREERKVMLKGL